MNTKLTLSIDKDVVADAKAYAKRKNRSLSNLIESFLRDVSSDSTKIENKDSDLHPTIAALKGSIKMPEDLSLDYKKEIQEARYERYLRKS
mgnify:CR=1 FL=1